MKKGKILTSVVSCAAAAAYIASSVSATVEIAETSTDYLVSDKGAWRRTIDILDDVDYDNLTRLEFIISFGGDKAQYESDLASGFYGDTENEFTDFSGIISFSGAQWNQFDFVTLAETEGDEKTAGLSYLGDDKYKLTADLTLVDTTINAPNYPSVSFAEWANSSTDYYLCVESAVLYGKDGEAVMSFSKNGEIDMNPQTEAEETAAETEAAETEVAVTEAATEAEVTTAAETTEAIEETTAAAEQPAQTIAYSRPAASVGDFSSRDSSLFIVLIVAGILILAAVAAILAYVFRKKK